MPTTDELDLGKRLLEAQDPGCADWELLRRDWSSMQRTLDQRAAQREQKFREAGHDDPEDLFFAGVNLGSRRVGLPPRAAQSMIRLGHEVQALRSRLNAKYNVDGMCNRLAAMYDPAPRDVSGYEPIAVEPDLGGFR